MECKGYICVVKRTGEGGSRCPVMDEYVIGTALNCDMRINLSTIAKQHCKIYVDESGQAFLQNLTKNYSTLLNGSALQFRQKRKLNHKDLITVAERSFRWEYLPSSAFYSLKKQSVTPLKSNLMDPQTSVKLTPDPCHLVVKISREESVLAENVAEKIKNSTLPVNKDYRHSLQAIEMLKTQSSPRPRRSCVPKFVVCDSNLDNNVDAPRARMKWQVTPQSARRISVTNLRDSTRKRGEFLLRKSILNSAKMSTPEGAHSKLKSLSEINRKSDALETVNKGRSLLNVGVTPRTNKKKMVEEGSLESLQKSAKRLKLSTTDNGTSSAVKQRRPLFSEVAKRIMKNKKSTPVRSSTVKTNRDKIQIKVVQSKPKVLSAIPKKFTTNSTGHAESPETIIIRKKLGTSRNITELKSVSRESRKSATKNVFPEKQNLTPGKITSASRLEVNPLNSEVKIASPADIYTPAASASKSKRCLQVNSLLKRADIQVTRKSKNLVNSSSIVKTTCSGGQTDQSTSEKSLSRPHDELSQDLSTLKMKSLRKTPLRMKNLARGSSKNLGRKLSLNLTPYKRRTKSVSTFEERRLSENIIPLQDLHFSKRSSVHEDADSTITLKESSDLAKKQNSPQGSIENPRHVCVSNVERQNASFPSSAQVDSPLKRKKNSFIATTSKNLSPNRDYSSSHEVVQMNVDVGFNMDATNLSSEKGLMKIRIETDGSAESGTDIQIFNGFQRSHSSSEDLADEIYMEKQIKPSRAQKSPRNDLTDVRGVKKLLGTPKEQKSPRNDLTNVRGVKKLLGTPKVHKSPKNDLTDVRGIKKLLRTPKVQKSPRNDLTDVRGIKKLLRTPKVQKSPRNDLTDLRGIKKLLRTPKEQKSPINDLTNVRGVKKLLGTPKVHKSPKNDLTDVRGIKKLLRTPKVQKSPRNDLTDVRGIKKLLRTPSVQKSPRNDLTDLRGIKKLLRTPKEQKSPINDLTDVRGVKKLLRTPKEQKSPINDLTDVRGVKKLLRTPKEQMTPNNNLMNVEGVKELYVSPDNQIACINELSKTNDLDVLFHSTRASSITNFKNLTELPLCFDNNGNQNLQTISTGIDHFVPEKSRRKAKVLKSAENPCNNNNNKTIAATSNKSLEELTPKPRPKKRLYNPENDPSVLSPRKRTRAAINSESQNQILDQEAILVIQDINGMPSIPKSDTQAETSCSEEQLEGKTIVDDHLAGVTGQKQKKEPKGVHYSPRIVATDLSSIKKVLKTPKLQKSPKNVLMSIRACIDEWANMSSQEKLSSSPPQESPITNVESSTELPLFVTKTDEQNFQTMLTTGVELPTPEKARRRGQVLIADASPYNNPTVSKSVKGLSPISDIKCIPSQRVTRGMLRHVEDVPNPEHGTKALSKRTRKQTVTKPVLEGSNTNDTSIIAPKTRHAKSKVAPNTSKTRNESSDSSKIDVSVPEEMLQDAASTPPQRTRRAKSKVAPNTSKTRKESSNSSEIDVSVPEEMLQDAASTPPQKTRRAKSKVAPNTSKTRKESSNSSEIDVSVPEEMLQDAASTPPQKTRRAKSKVAPNTSKTRKESSNSSEIDASVPEEMLQDAASTPPQKTRRAKSKVAPNTSKTRKESSNSSEIDVSVPEEMLQDAASTPSQKTRHAKSKVAPKTSKTKKETSNSCKIEVSVPEEMLQDAASTPSQKTRHAKSKVAPKTSKTKKETSNSCKIEVSVPEEMLQDAASTPSQKTRHAKSKVAPNTSKTRKESSNSSDIDVSVPEEMLQDAASTPSQKTRRAKSKVAPKTLKTRKERSNSSEIDVSVPEEMLQDAASTSSQKTRHAKSKVAPKTLKTRKESSNSSEIDVSVPEEMLQDAASTSSQKTRRAKSKVAPKTLKTRKESSNSSEIDVSVREEMLQDAASTSSQKTRHAKSKVAPKTLKTRKESSNSSEIDVSVPEEMLQDAASTSSQKTRRAKCKIAPKTLKTRNECTNSSKIEVSVPKEILQDATNTSSPILDKSTNISKSSPIRVTRRFLNKTSTTQNTESNLLCLPNVVSEFSQKRRTRSQKSNEASSKNHNSNSEGVKASTGSLGKISNKETAKKHYQEETTVGTDTSRGTRTCKIKNTIDSEVTRRTRRRV